MRPMTQNNRANAARCASSDVATLVSNATVGLVKCCSKRDLHWAVSTIGNRRPGSLREGNS